MLKLNEIKIDIPKYPKEIIETLENNGYEAYIVGGCVRDALLGKSPSDYDITTNADPQTVKKLFRRTIDTGIKHGTVTVLFYEGDKPYTYEVTTYRIDGEYDDARHPKNVVFVDNLKEDLLRRDFTINAMAYNNKKGLVDEFGGIVDLDKKIIRAVGNPIERFTEDALRLLRAVRFAAKLGFSIEEETEKAIPKLAKNLSYVSKERIQVELTKTITSAYPELVNKIFELGIAKYLCEGLENIKVGRIGNNLPIYLAYACFLYHTDVNMVNKILRNLRLDNNNILKTMYLIESKKCYNLIYENYKNKKYEQANIYIKELVNFLGYDLTYDFIKLLDINDNNKALHDIIREYVVELKSSHCPVFISDLKVDGNDMINIGFKGQEIGLALSELLKIVHKNRGYNDKKLLQEVAKKAYNTYKGEAYEL